MLINSSLCLYEGVGYPMLRCAAQATTGCLPRLQTVNMHPMSTHAAQSKRGIPVSALAVGDDAMCGVPARVSASSFGGGVVGERVPSHMSRARRPSPLTTVPQSINLPWGTSLPTAMPHPDALPTLQSFRKQQLLVEFSGLRHASLDGVFVSITPGDPSLWVGVIFVRKGPYAPAVLRFQISFPPNYPALPPLVTFSTDVFHPLLTPLTTYTYTTGSTDAGTVSATDDERLPPGGFSLRHGFPQWFGRARQSAASSRNVSGSGADSTPPSITHLPPDLKENPFRPVPSDDGAGKPISIVRVIDYVRTTFSDEHVLDSIPLEAAAHPSAYHAWQAYRAATLQRQQPSPKSPTSESQVNSNEPNRQVEHSTLGRNRRPGEWNWEGVWEERVRKAVKSSLSEPVLFGGASGEDIIRFRNVDEDNMERMKDHLDTIASRSATV
ncbi:unnamed protein product [Periconia digitata]|uniref:UBC core domain-containing protein n=1 Tax=Periconia digitata TaxID=1303443 RepID=A0A9W4U9G8_9PLEO|nr:unnamed protein product [Periconia digitata]